MGDISQLAASDKQLRNLKISPAAFHRTLGAEGDFQRLTWKISRRETRTHDRTATGFKMNGKMQQGGGLTVVSKAPWAEVFVASAKDAS